MSVHLYITLPIELALLHINTSLETAYLGKLSSFEPAFILCKHLCCLSLCQWLLYSINNGTFDMSIVFFCELSLFVNFKYLHNIRDDKLNQVLLIYLFYTENLAYRAYIQNFQPIFNKIQPKFNGFVLGFWPTLR